MISKIILNIPLKKILKLLDNKYKYEIIYNLTLNKMRFGEIKENIATITQQLLTKQLKQLEKNNLIARKKYNGFPRKVEYSLTSFGQSLKPLINIMKKWEEKNIKLINKQLKKKKLYSLYDYY
jgi:DNA-binding HxlR family transcriptional regulator|tara:strand:- start:1376 stop:1744 length:369 start_codon:yes stop_codon:yes gene_type:complete